MSNISFAYKVTAYASGKKAGVDTVFTVYDNFQTTVPSTSYNHESAIQISPSSIGNMLSNKIGQSATTLGIDLNTVTVTFYTVESLNAEVEIFTKYLSPSNQTTDPLDKIYAFFPYGIMPPLMPKNFTATSTTDSITLAWEENSSTEIGFRIYNDKNSLLTEVAKDILAWRHTELQAGKKYTYQLASFNSYGESKRLSVSIETKPVALTPPSHQPVDREDDERIQAFQSGIGDGLDLKVRTNRNTGAYETFGYWMQIKGYEKKNIPVYPKRYFKYQFSNGTVTSPWYEGSIDGDDYTLVSAGKKNTVVPVDIEATGTITVTTNDALVTGTISGDTVTFTSGSGASVNQDVEFPWYGPRVYGQGRYALGRDQVLVINENVPAPYYDPSLTGRTMTRWSILVMPDNYNVRLWVAEEPTFYMLDTSYLHAALKAQVINATQVPWNPLIHNGYYYLNQSEHFLFSESQVQGYYKGTKEYIPLNFVYTIDMDAKDQSNAAVKYSSSQLATLTSDNMEHLVSKQSITDIMTAYLTQLGVDITKLTSIVYTLRAADPTVVVLNIQNNFIYGKTTTLAQKTVFDQVKINLDDSGEALVTPVPQQGCPVLVQNSAGKDFRRVTFYDEDGNLTLENKEYFTYTGDQEFFLQQIEIDPLTLVVEQQTLNTKNFHVWTPIATVKTQYADNVVTLLDLYPDQTNFRIRYQLKDSFYVIHNNDSSLQYAKLKVHSQEFETKIAARKVRLAAETDPDVIKKGYTLDEQIDIKVSYETDTESAYYSASEVDLNPIRNLQSSGFLYITEAIDPAQKIELYANPKMIYATLGQFTYVRAVVMDQYNNPIVGAVVNFSGTGNGIIDVIQGKTDSNGVAIAKVNSTGMPGPIDLVAQVGAVVSSIHLESKYPTSSARLCLQSSASTLIANNTDTVTLTVSLYGDDQLPAANKNIDFMATDGAITGAATATQYMVTTDSYGKAVITMKASSVPASKMLQVTAQCAVLSLTSEMNLKVGDPVV